MLKLSKILIKKLKIKFKLKIGKIRATTLPSRLETIMFIFLNFALKT